MVPQQRLTPIIQVARATELTIEAAAKATAAVDELHRASRMVTMVARVATAVAQSAHVSELAEAVLDETLGALEAAASCLYMYDQDKRELRLASYRRFVADVVERISTISLDTPGVASRAARTLSIEVVDDVRESDELPIVRESVERISARYLVAVPLIAAEKLVGVLVYVHTLTHAFSENELGTLETVGSIVGVGLSHALTQEHLALERARLASILEHAPHGILYLDLIEQRVVANPAAERLLDVNVAGPLGRAPVRTYRPDGTPLTDREEPSKRAMRGETLSHEEVLVETPNGTKRPMLVSATPVVGAGRSIDGVVIAFEDISVLKELDRLREEFAAIVAHDLRNPISAILMSAEMMLKTASDGQVVVRTSSVERIRQSAARLGEMVKDLLDASRVEIGQLHLDRKPLEATDAVNALVARIQPTLGEHPVEVDAENARLCVTADPLRFEQIFTNLVENAAKYSADGAPITIRVRRRDNGVAFSVIDQGLGIAPNELPLLFDRFFQAKRAREMRKGIGLGLYITKGLVEAHGGRIMAESTPGRGSAFHVWLPCTPSEAWSLGNLAQHA